jgi:hypothetical protein
MAMAYIITYTQVYLDSDNHMKRHLLSEVVGFRFSNENARHLVYLLHHLSRRFDAVILES